MDQLPRSILDPEIRAICERYRVSPEEAEAALRRELAARPQLTRIILERCRTEDVTRLREYKNAIKRARKRIYYSLRRYHRDTDAEELLTEQLANEVREGGDHERTAQLCHQLLLGHASTRERCDYYEEFYEGIFKLIGAPRTILDLACGIHPLSYPFARQRETLQVYAAIDKDTKSIKILNAFSSYALPTRLIPIHADLADLDFSSRLVDDVATFDVAFMLKLIPVLARQRRKLLPMLAQVPARQLLITASTESMTRKQRIANREDKALQSFIRLCGRTITGEFSIANEFGYLLT